MKKYLPSKKFSLFILVFVVLGVLAWLGSSVFANKKVYKAETQDDAFTQIANPENIEEFAQLDSDGDGLFDWEEALWGTDEFNPDSDGDGVTDAEFVAKQRKEIQGEDDALVSAEEESLNQTERLAREFFMTASLIDQGEVNPDTINAFGQSFNGQVAQRQIIPDLYTLADINIGSIPPETYVSDYQSINAFIDANSLDEVGIVAGFASGRTTADTLEDLNGIVLFYNELADRLLAMDVPAQISGTHLDLANSVQKVAISLENLKFLADDPFRALIGINQYMKYADEVVFYGGELQSYFN